MTGVQARKHDMYEINFNTVRNTKYKMRKM